MTTVLTVKHDFKLVGANYSIRGIIRSNLLDLTIPAHFRYRMLKELLCFVLYWLCWKSFLSHYLLQKGYPPIDPHGEVREYYSSPQFGKQKETRETGDSGRDEKTDTWDEEWETVLGDQESSGESLCMWFLYDRFAYGKVVSIPIFSGLHHQYERHSA